MNTYFVLSLVSLLTAIVIVALKVCYASKCEKISICCGVLEINREVSLENAELSADGNRPKVFNLITRMRSEKNNLPAMEL